MISETENDIIGRILQGDKKAFSMLVEKYKNLVYAIILRLVNNHEEADDLAQDTFLKAFNNIKKYKSEYNFRNWIYTIALNNTRNYLRKKKILSILPFSQINVDRGENRKDIENILHPDNHNNDSNSEIMSIIDDIMKYLKGREKELFSLFYLHGVSCQDISSILGLSENNVKVMLHRQRKKIYYRFKDRLDVT